MARQRAHHLQARGLRHLQAAREPRQHDGKVPFRVRTAVPARGAQELDDDKERDGGQGRRGDRDGRERDGDGAELHEPRGRAGERPGTGREQRDQGEEQKKDERTEERTGSEGKKKKTEKRSRPRPRPLTLSLSLFRNLHKNASLQTTNAVYNLTVGKAVNATVYKVSFVVYRNQGEEEGEKKKGKRERDLN